LNPPVENLVFFPDSPFAIWIIDRCERLFPGFNTYVSFGEKSKNFSSDKVRMVGLDLPALKEFSKELNRYKRIIIHYHHEITGYLIELANVPPQKIIWMLWSGDLYNCPFYKGELYLPLTAQHEAITSFPELEWKSKLKEKSKQYLRRPGYYLYKKSFQRIQQVGSFFPEDVKNASLTFGKSYTHFFHGIISVREQVKDSVNLELPELGGAILLGHAGVPELNHLDMIQRFGSHFSARKVICPLSYGNPEYINTVRDFGLASFGDRFEPIQEYMPREEYYHKLQEASFAVFGALVHQGFGNLMTLLFMGFKVFMFNENPVYIQLKNLGLILFPLESLESNSFKNPLSREEKNHNRTILNEVLSEDRVDDYYRSVYLFSVDA
jgi:dTDP-N-acetylfucosamine:lipid II N-acetylfucosaminyltransferase